MNYAEHYLFAIFFTKQQQQQQQDQQFCTFCQLGVHTAPNGFQKLGSGTVKLKECNFFRIRLY